MAKLADLVSFAMDVKGVNQTQLAEAIGLSQASVNAIVNGKTAKPSKWQVLAKYLGITTEEMLAAMAETQAFLDKTKRHHMAGGGTVQHIYPQAIQSGATTFPPSLQIISAEANARIGEPLNELFGDNIPVYGKAQGGPDGRFEFNGEVMGWEPRPPNLKGVRDVYAVYIDGESMWPRYKPGETVVAHPGRPVARGDDVVVQVANEDQSESPLGYVKEFVSMSQKEVVLSQFNPATEIRIPRDRVVSIHRIVSAGR